MTFHLNASLFMIERVPLGTIVKENVYFEKKRPAEQQLKQKGEEDEEEGLEEEVMEDDNEDIFVS